MPAPNGAPAQKLWALLQCTGRYAPYFGVDEIFVDESRWAARPTDVSGKLAALFVEWFSMKPMLAYHGALNEKILEEAKSKYGATITKMEGAFREEARKRTAHLRNDYVAGGGEQAAKSAALLKQLG